MGGRPPPAAIADAAPDLVVFVVLDESTGTNGAPPRAPIKIKEVLRGGLTEGEREASFPPPSDEPFYARRQGGEEGLARWQAQGREGPPALSERIAAVYPQDDGSVMVDPRACWPNNNGHRARAVWGASAALTMIAIPAEDPDAFQSISVRDRKHQSRGWKRLPVRSGRRLCTFLMFATHVDLGVFGCTDEDGDGERVETQLLPRTTMIEDLPVLVRLVEEAPDATARALWEHGGGLGDLARIGEALRSGTWPTSDDPAEEAAAFAHQLLKYGRIAVEREAGVCWEYRGDVRAQVSPAPTERTRALETLYARLGAAAPAERAAAAAALEELVAATRTSAPAQLAAWVLAHDAYLGARLHRWIERGEGDAPAAAAARRERAAWAEVRAGARAFVEERAPDAPIDAYLYGRYFGIDPETLAPVEEARGTAERASS